MKLAEKTVKEYLDLLGSDAPVPGGGSASALCGAQGAALVAMVAGLSVGKAKYAQYQELYPKTIEAATKIKEELINQADRDTEAYNLVMQAYKLPKDTDEEREYRTTSITSATRLATQVPFDTMKYCLGGLRVTQKLVGCSNVNAASDLGVAALNLLAGVKGAWQNVLINLQGLNEEKELIKYRKEGERIVWEAEMMAEEIYRAVIKNM